MSEFEKAFAALNDAQKTAVRKIEGPVLAIAGPGTGKTQLLGTRAAFIARQGAVNPGNILCLTYTDAAATELRARLGKIMGPQGGEVAVHTFHSFGSWIIREYADQSAVRSRSALDALGRFHIIEELLARLPLRHPFAQRGDNDEFARQKAVTDAIEAFKKAGVHADELRKLATENEAAYKTLQPLLNEIFGSTLSAKRLANIDTQVTEQLQNIPGNSYAAILLSRLSKAIEQSIEAGVTKKIGDWRTKHTVSDGGKRILKSAKYAEKLRELIQLYEQYQNELSKRGRFDYDDMILDAVATLESNEDTRLDIAERFQYIMVDEYQDTNGAQNRLLSAILSAHPTDAPNVLVVGDDEQAIMRFQGAEVSGILEFIRRYQPYKISLSENYRSGQAILDAARQIITQTDERLETTLGEGFAKKLIAKNEPERTVIEHRAFESSSAEYAAVAEHIKQLLKDGVPANQIAVIGRKHPELKTFAPFMAARGIAIDYDKRENVLQHEHIAQLLTLAEYVHMLSQQSVHAGALLPDVLSAPYWEMPPTILYDIALVAKGEPWLKTMLESDDERWQQIAEWLLAAAKAAHLRNFTQMFDVLIGREPLGDTALKTSPLGKYLANAPSEQYITLLAHLIRLRGAVLNARPTANSLGDLLDVTHEYRRNGLELTDDNPILRGDAGKVSVLSAHSAKGREFEHVIILSAVDSVWGPSARGNNQKIPLPENLQIYPTGDSDADKLRLLYVAMTRAKSHLLLTSYHASDEGKAAVPLSYLRLGDEPGWWQPHEEATSDATTTLETAWSARGTTPPQDFATMLRPVLANWRISPSALRAYLDVCYSNPLAAIEQHVLKFPSAYNRHSALGSAVHKTLAFVTANMSADVKAALDFFDAELAGSGLTPSDTESVRLAGHSFLPPFLKQFELDDITASEQYFKATLPGLNIPIGGQIDALKEKDGALTIIDYKTGVPPENGWDSRGLKPGKQVSLHFYRQQLLFYKLLLEATGRTVAAAELVFVEPDTHGNFVRLHLDQFDPEELARTAQLIKVVYTYIMQAKLPEVSSYRPDTKGVQQFEQDLLEGRV